MGVMVDFIEAGNLVEEWVVPPFTVLDTRQGYWQERRRRWLSLGILSEVGREGGLAYDTPMDWYRQHGTKPPAGLSSAAKFEAAGALQAPASKEPGLWGETLPDTRKKDNGTSVFDPVLAEAMYRWFCPAGGTILDPFAGGSVRGIVAALTGHPYTGIELSGRQVEANRQQALDIVTGDIKPTWIHGDSAEQLLHVEAHDMVFTCPPYYDLEVYSDDPRDISAAGSYRSFLTMYRDIAHKAVMALKPGGFIVYVVSEVRGDDGSYVGLVPDTVAALRDAGADFYNEAILVNAIGSLPIRARRAMLASRKLGRCHQNVIVARKGGGSTRGWEMDTHTAPDPQLTILGDE